MLHEQEPENRSRQEQILLMAADGMTDKEIASRLGLSPETIGTYWRRILAKYSAASRTEVVAKVIRLQGEASMGQLNDLNESLREVTDHLLWQLSERKDSESDLTRTIHEQILDALPELVVMVDGEGFLLYSNGEERGLAFAIGEPFEWAVEKDDVERLRDALGSAFGGDDISVSIHIDGKLYDGRVVVLKSEEPSAVVSLRLAA